MRQHLKVLNAKFLNSGYAIIVTYNKDATGAEVTAALGEREHWSEPTEVVHSTKIEVEPSEGKHSDSPDPKSE